MMQRMSRLYVAVCCAGLAALLAAPLPAAADENGEWTWTDARREGAIWSAFAFNNQLNPFELRVDVSDGVATLSGTVDEETKRDLAGEIALGVDGVDEVENNIEVDAEHEAPDTAEGRTLEQTARDATITAAVKSRLLWNRNTPGLDIQVRTDNGVTTLSGRAATAEQRDLAGELAANTRGVESVNNDLTVDADVENRLQGAVDDAAGRVSDGWITTKVKSALVFTRGVPGGAIQVRTDDGVVQLSGHVDTDSERALAITTAEEIAGVESVDASALVVDE